MNTNHRIVWSQAHQAYVVTHENAKSQGRPSLTVRTAMATAVAALFLAPSLSGATCAVSGISPITTVLTATTCFEDVDVTIDLGAGVSLTTSTTLSSALVLSPLSPYTKTFNNQGTITSNVTANNTSGYGVQVTSGIDSTGVFTNTSGALISMTAQGTGTLGGYGVRISGDMAGTFTNAGTLQAHATGNKVSGLYGLYVGGALSGILSNSGTISTTTNVTGSSAYLYDYPSSVYISGDFTGTFQNTGVIQSTNTITATSTGIPAPTAYGVYFDGGSFSGTLTNSGTISATINASIATGNSNFYVSGVGLYIDTAMAGLLNNTNSIAVNATGANFTNIYGIKIDGQLSGTLTNSGTISVVAYGSSGTAKAYGLWSGPVTGTLNNSGLISVTSTNNNAWAAASPHAYAYGVHINGLIDSTGVLTNSGTISATVSAPNGTATGLYASTLDGAINNSGVITASGSGGIASSQLYSINVPSGSGTINNLTNGLLEGRLNLGDSVNLINSGTVDIRKTTSSIANNYTQGASGTFKIGAASNISYGKLNIAGTASLTANSFIYVAVDTANSLVVGDILDNVLSAGTLSMSTLSVNDNSSVFNFLAVDDGANGIDLTVVLAPPQPPTIFLLNSVRTAGGSVASQNLAALFDTLLPTASSQPTEIANFLSLLSVSGNTPQQINAIIASALPTLSGGNTLASFSAMHTVQRLIELKQDNNLGRPSGDSFYGNKKFWLKPFGSLARQADRQGVSGFDATTYGMIVGSDADVSDVHKVGAAFAYSRSKVGGNDNFAQQGNIVQNNQLVLYGSYALSPDTQLSYQADLGLHKNKTTRENVGGAGLTANAAYSSTSMHVGLGYAKTKKLDEKSSWTPAVRVDYTRMRDQGYIESGAGALNLLVDARTTQELILGFDAKYNRALSGQSTFSANLGLGYNTMNKPSAITAAFAGLSSASFTTAPIHPSPWMLRAGVGLVYKTASGMEITLRYDLEGRRGFVNQTPSLQFRWSF